ncbi:hypothetical protein [Solibacillus sp. CAU 1738]|uniref:hypothetical protein n=1 Tax=Solibacillus sp. CAU 1738 TaxID=3140363 RepID=UPI0032614A5D
MGSNKIQLTLIICYPIWFFVMFAISKQYNIIYFFFISLFIVLFFKNIRNLLISTTLLWSIAAPLYYHIILKSYDDWGADMFRAYFLIYLIAFIVFVLFPQIILVRLVMDWRELKK